MSPAYSSELFWNAPHKFELSRAVDPLGFDALREAMSNVLAPFLTGGTRHAEHYIAVAVGLRWASAIAESKTDKEIWPHFGAFERGLLQYWHRRPAGRPSRTRYLGKRIISKICKGKKPDLGRAILVDQRGIGLLGTYVESLRAIGLVRPARIEIDEARVESLLGESRFEWSGAGASWSALDSTFQNVDQRSAWGRLGKLLFGVRAGTAEQGRMHQAARAVRGNPRAVSWRGLAASSNLLESQRRVATATESVTELEEQLRALFSEILNGHRPSVGKASAAIMARCAKRLTDLKIIEVVWAKRPPLGEVLSRQIESVTSSSMSADALLKWHREVMRARRVEPWIDNLGERSPLRLTLRQARVVAKIIAFSIDAPVSRSPIELKTWWARHYKTLGAQCGSNDLLEILSHLESIAGKAKRLPVVARYDGDVSGEEENDRKFNLPCAPLVLVASRKAQEGIDLHHYCRRVVLYDLPWNPALIEQRIGRVHRLGGMRSSSQPVEVVYCYQKGSYEDVIAQRIKLRCKMMHALLGAGTWLNREREVENLERYRMTFPP